MQLSKPEMIARAASETIFSREDVEALCQCSPDEIEMVVKAIHDRNDQPPHSTWSMLLLILSDCVDVADVIIPLTSAVTGLYAVGKL